MVLSFSVVTLIATFTLACFQSFLILSFWSVQRYDRTLLWMAAWLLTSSLFILSRLLHYTELSHTNHVLSARVMLTAGYSLVWLGYELANVFIKRSQPRWERALIFSMIAVPVLFVWAGPWIVANQVVERTAALGGTFTGVQPGPFYLPVSLWVLALSALPIGLLVLAKTKPRRENLLLAAGFLLMVFFSLVDFLTVVLNRNWVRFTDFANLPVAIVYSFIVVTRIGRTYRDMNTRVTESAAELHQKNETLRSEVARRTEAETEIQRLFQAAKRQADELEILNQVGQRLAGTLHLPEIIDQLGMGAGELFRPRNFSVLFYNQERARLEGNVYVERGSRKELLRAPLRKGLTGALIAGRKPILAVDYVEECQRRSIELAGKKPRAWLGVPVMGGDKVFGVITVWDDESDHQFGSRDMQVLSTLAAQAAIAIHNAQLFEALRSSENKFATAFRTSPDAVTINRLSDTRFIEVNNGFTTLSGYTPSEVIGKTFDEINLWSDHDHRPPLQNMLRERSLVTNLEVSFRCKNGRVLTGLLSATIIEFAGETCLLSFTRDISALKHVQEEILRKAKEADAIAQIGRDISSTLKLDVVLERIAYHVKVLLRAETSAVYMAEAGARKLRAVVAMGPDAEEIKNDPLQLGEGILGNIAMQKQGEIVNNTDQDPRSIIVQGTERLLSEHLMGVPVLSKDRLIGLIAVWRNGAGREFERADLNFMSSIAHQTAIAIENASLFENTHRRLSEIEAVHTMSTALRSARSLDEALPIILDQLMTLMNAGGASLEMLDPVNGEIVTELANGEWSQVTGMRSPAGQGISGYVMTTGQPYVTADVVGDERALYPESFYGLTAVACIPVIAQQQPIGALWVGRATAILEEEVSLLAAIGEMVGNAIRRMRLHEQTEHLLEELQVANSELAEAYDTTLEGWSRALELRDKETEGHSRRVTELTLRLARCMDYPEADIPHLRRGVLLHDIGKMGISDQLLKKTGPLTEDEWVEMRKHPMFAYVLLHPIAYLRPALDVPLCHHERWDGTGYPRALKGKEIPLAARIFSVVDVYDAISNDRPYRVAWPHHEVMKYLREHSGKQFDPQVVDIIMKMMEG